MVCLVFSTNSIRMNFRLVLNCGTCFHHLAYVFSKWKQQHPANNSLQESQTSLKFSTLHYREMNIAFLFYPPEIL